MGRGAAARQHTAYANCVGGDVKGELRRRSEGIRCKIICNEGTLCPKRSLFAPNTRATYLSSFGARGYSSTSRILDIPVRYITIRSKPIPKPL